MKNTYTYGTTPVEIIAAAIDSELGTKPYHMELVGEDAELMVEIVNQGIDAHLEAFTESKFNGNERRLHCDMSKKDMLVLLRRLNESENENAMSLRTGILTTLEIEEV